MARHRSSGIPPTIKLEPQLRHSYVSPSDNPGVSHFMLQVGHVVKGRLKLRSWDTVFSDCIAGSIIRHEARPGNQSNHLGRLGD